MDALAIIVEAPRQIALRSLSLNELGPSQCTRRNPLERHQLRHRETAVAQAGKMPPFPGHGLSARPGI